jgi:hypothetical protein
MLSLRHAKHAFIGAAKEILSKAAPRDVTAFSAKGKTFALIV